MGIVDTDFYTDENGVEMRKDTYANGMVIKIPLRVSATEESDQIDTDDQFRADMDYLKMMGGA